jgi:hypothetical protein
MPLIQSITSDQEDLRKMLTELEHDSDRAAGIVGAVLVEESLTVLLKSRLLSDEDLIRETFRSSGPLGAFSVKITIGFLLGLYSLSARKELETIKEIRNEFAHRIARSFSFVRIRDLANNLSLSESVEFHMTTQESEQSVLYIGAKPPPEQSSVPILPPITQDKLTPRERYLRACQFYSGALLLTANALPKSFQATYF